MRSVRVVLLWPCSSSWSRSAGLVRLGPVIGCMCGPPCCGCMRPACGCSIRTSVCGPAFRIHMERGSTCDRALCTRRRRGCGCAADLRGCRSVQGGCILERRMCRTFFRTCTRAPCTCNAADRRCSFARCSCNLRPCIHSADPRMRAVATGICIRELRRCIAADRVRNAQVVLAVGGSLGLYPDGRGEPAASTARVPQDVAFLQG